MAAVVLATLLAFATGASPAAASEVLTEPGYGFCHDGDYPLTAHEAQWCPLLREAEDISACPAFVQACDAPRAELLGEGRLSSRSPVHEAKSEREQNEEQRGQRPPADADAAERVRRRGMRNGPSREADASADADAATLPSLGGFAAVLFWLIIVVGVGVVIAAVFRNRSSARSFDAGSADPSDTETEGPGADRGAATRAMETDVERLLDLARRSAQQGAFGEAVDYAHAALLRRLDHEGLIRLHASRTNGEYVRELRGHTSLLGPVRDALRRVDRAQFGPSTPERSVFDDIHARVVSIVKRVGPLAVLVAWVMGAAGACGDRESRSYGWAKSPSGTAGVIAFLRTQDTAVRYRTRTLASLEADEAYDEPTIVMLAEAEASLQEWEALERWVRGGGRLIVAGAALPPWLQVSYEHEGDARLGDAVLDVHADAAGSAAEQEHALDLELDSLDPLDSLDLGLDPDAPNPGLGPVLPASRTLVLREPAAEVGIDRHGGRATALFRRGRGSIEVFADGRLFTNAALVFPANAQLLADLLPPGSEVELVDGWATLGADTPTDAIDSTHLTAAVVQLLVLIAAFYLWRGRRFGRGRDPTVQQRRAFSRHAVAMGRQYERARAASFAASLFSGWALERLRNRFSSAASAGLHGLSQEIARRSGRNETDVMRLLVAAHTAAEADAAPGGGAEDLALVRDLGQLMRETGDTP